MFKFLKNKTKEDVLDTLSLGDIIKSVDYIIKNKDNLVLIQETPGYIDDVSYAIRCVKCGTVFFRFSSSMTLIELNKVLIDLKNYECVSCEEVLNKFNTQRAKWLKYEDNFIKNVPIGSRVKVTPSKIYNNTSASSRMGNLNVIYGVITGYTDEVKHSWMEEDNNHKYYDKGKRYDYNISKVKPIVVSDKGLEELIIDCVRNVEIIDEITKDEKEHIIKLLIEEGQREHNNNPILARNRKIIDKLNSTKN